MLTSLTPLLKPAVEGSRAIGSFNVYSYETIRGVLEAGAATKTPVIVAFGERYLPQMSFDTVVAICTTVAENVDVDYAIHLDHCKSLDNIYRAMKAGFTSVMIDGSALRFDDNIALTARAVDVAHALGVSVEAELGSLASGDDSQEGEHGDTQEYTDPERAQEFVERTRTDALAVSIGTVHGTYKAEPRIRLDILRSIREEVPVPLVLHGGSGTPPDTLDACIAEGIAKINVNTEISTHAATSVSNYLHETARPHLSTVSEHLVGSVKDIVSTYITMFSR